MSSTGWPPFDDRDLTPEERELLKDVVLRRLIERSERAEKAHIFDHEDTEVLKLMIRLWRAGRLAGVVLGKAGKISVPLVAFLVAVLAGWDKVVIAAKAAVSVFR